MSLWWSRDGAPQQLPHWMAQRTDATQATLVLTPLWDGSKLVTVWTGIDLGWSTATPPVGAPVVPFLTFRQIDDLLPQPLATWETEGQAREGHAKLVEEVEKMAHALPAPAVMSKRPGVAVVADPALVREEAEALAKLEEIRARLGRRA